MTQDFNKTMQDMMSAFPMDTSAMQDAFRTQAQLAERLSRVALDAAEQSTEISSSWTKETLSKLRDVATVKDEPADYSKALTQLTSAQAETTSEAMARFAEVAKRVQMDTVELMLSAGKEFAEDTAQQTRVAAERSQRAAKDMAVRGQQIAGKSQEAMTRMAEQGREATDKFAAQGKDATDKFAAQGKDATDKFAAQSKDATDRFASASKDAADKTASASKDTADKSSTASPQVSAKATGTTGKATAGAK